MAANIASIAKMSGGTRIAPQAIQAIATDCAQLVMSTPPKVGLVVYGFDAAQRDHSSWTANLKALKAAIGDDLVKTKGDPKGLKL